MAEPDWEGYFAGKTRTQPPAPPTSDWEGHFGARSPFPAGEKPAEVEQKRGLARLEMIPQAIMTGAQTVAGLPGTVEGMIRGATPDSWGRAFAETKPGLNALMPGPWTPSGQLIPSRKDISDWTGMGLENHPELKPEGWEKYGVAR